MKRYNGVLDEKSSVLLYDYDIVCGSSEDIELPDEYMLPKDKIPDCRDQKDTSQCVAFATTNIMQILNQIETGQRERFSTTYVYGRHREDFERSAKGMYPERVLEKLRKLGSVKEELIPELLENPEAYDFIQHHSDLDELDRQAEPYKIDTYVGFTPYGDSKKRAIEPKMALLKYEIPLLGIMTTPDGTHAIALIGWDKDGFYYMNSWGKYCGDNGVCHMEYGKLRRAYMMIDAKNTNDFPFTDVEEDRWSRKAIEHCYNAGLVNGKGNNIFDPSGNLTREEMCQILYKFAKKMEEGE